MYFKDVFWIGTWLLFELDIAFSVEGVNLALFKNANQTGTYNDAVASNAVDGKYDDNDVNYLTVCAHPDSGDWGPAKWMVDLGDLYLIRNVTVYNTHDDGSYWRMNQFIVNIMSSTTPVRCDKVAGPVKPGGFHTFECASGQGIVGRYVSVERLEGSKEQRYITICEVVVKGELARSTTTRAGFSTTVGGSTTVGQRPGEGTLSTIAWSLFGFMCGMNIILVGLLIQSKRRKRRPVHILEGSKQENTPVSSTVNSVLSASTSPSASTQLHTSKQLPTNKTESLLVYEDVEEIKVTEAVPPRYQSIVHPQRRPKKEGRKSTSNENDEIPFNFASARSTFMN